MKAASLRFEGGVAWLTLARPARHNAVDAIMKDDLARAVVELTDLGAALRVLVITGAGASFCSGADLAMLRELTPEEARRFMLDAAGTFRRLARLPVPVIVAVRGYCLGGGLELLLHADIAVAADDASFGFPEATLGLVTTAGAVGRLLVSVGASRARDMLLTGRRLRADEALAFGLVAEVVAGDALEAAVTQRARSIVAMPPEGLRAVKDLLSRRLDADFSASFLAEVETFDDLLRARAARAGAP